jgi:hypothetical protein
LNEYVVTISINGEIKPLDVYTRSTRRHLCVVRRIATAISYSCLWAC